MIRCLAQRLRTGSSGRCYELPGSLLLNRFQVQVRTATKKAGGSTQNGRDTCGKRLGIKIFGDQKAKPGSIIIRQKGTKFFPGFNVGIGRDHTIYSLIPGLVKFYQRRQRSGKMRRYIGVEPFEQPVETVTQAAE